VKVLFLPLITALTSCVLFLHTPLMVAPGWTAEPVEYYDAAYIMAFADTLFHQGHHYRTIMEYERFIYFYPKHPEVPKAQFTIACAMKSTGHYAPALELFASLAKEHEGTHYGIEALVQVAEIFYLMHDYPSALKHYKGFLLQYPQHQLAEKARDAIEEIEK